jgi:hypothetical protein
MCYGIKGEKKMTQGGEEQVFPTEAIDIIKDGKSNATNMLKKMDQADQLHLSSTDAYNRLRGITSRNDASTNITLDALFGLTAQSDGCHK